MSNPNPRAVSEKYKALRKRTKDEDVSKLNALFQKAIVDIKLIKRQRAAQESKSAEGVKAKAEADRVRMEAEKAKAKSAEAKKSIEREIILTKRKIRDVSMKAKKASANVDRARKEIRAASARRDTRKVEKLTRFSRKRQQNLLSAREVRGKLITGLRDLEKKSAKVSPLMLTQGSPMTIKSAQQSPQVQAKSQQFLAEKARAQSSQIQAKAQQFMTEKAKTVASQTEKQLVSKARSVKLEQEKRQKSAKAQSVKLEQDKRQKSAKIEQDKRQQLAKAQSAKAQSAKMELAKRQQIQARTAQKKQMIQQRPPKMMKMG